MHNNVWCTAKPSSRLWVCIVFDWHLPDRALMQKTAYNISNNFHLSRGLWTRITENTGLCGSAGPNVPTKMFSHHNITAGSEFLGHFLTLTPAHTEVCVKRVLSRHKTWPVTDLGYINISPRDIGQLWARLNEDLGEVVVVVAGGHHVDTHQDVEGQCEHWQIPATVNRCQGTGHNRAEK